MSNNLRVNVLNGFNCQMPQFQVSSAYTKRAWAKNIKNGSTYPFSTTNHRTLRKDYNMYPQPPSVTKVFTNAKGNNN